jgi:ABC-type enterobactin transport system permease subunit
MSEEHLVVGLRPHMIESQRKETASVLVVVSSVIVLVILDILADSVPSDSFYFLHFVGIVEDFHAIVVERIRFG